MTRLATVLLFALTLATAGLASADHEVPSDPFAEEDPLFSDEDEGAFEELLNEAPEPLPEATDALTGEEDEEEEQPPPPPEDEANQTPGPGLLALLAMLALTAAKRRA